MWLLIQISVTPSDMGEACSLLSFRRSAILLCSYVVNGYVNYDYLVVEIYDSKNGWLSYHACLAYVANLLLLLLVINLANNLLKVISSRC
jgi:hypothetical protein